MTRRELLVGASCSALIFGAGCGAGAPAPAASAAGSSKTASPGPASSAGTRCALSGGVEGASAPRVFIEVAAAQGELSALVREHPPVGLDVAPGAAFDAWVGDPRLKRLNVFHLLAPNDMPASARWELEGREGGEEPLDIIITPHVDGPAPQGVRMQVTMAGLAHTTVVVHDQQSVVFGGFPAPIPPGSQALFVLTPYVIWNDADLGRLLECKRRWAGNGGVARRPELP